jgi:hypothetical protein
MPRGQLLRLWFAQERTIVLERDGHTAGFAVLRRFGRAHAVGPLAAPDLDALRLLIAGCVPNVGGAAYS